MKSKLSWIMTLLLAFFIQTAFAQEKTVSGTVTDDTGAGLPGVSVVVQGTTRGTQTDFDGKYSIKASQGEKLVFSFLGMDTQTVSVGASNTVSLQLKMASNNLIEVVVEGYGITRTKPKSNVAATTVSAATIETRPNASFIQTLQSQVAGLNIATGTGQPGGNSQVILRGVGTLNGKFEPLYVIDGVPLNSDNFRSLNPDDIQSVAVLKDAAATSKYGNRGSNGVIVVTTKRGTYDSSMSIKYSVTTGFSELQGTKYNMMNSRQILELERRMSSLPGQNPLGLGGAGSMPFNPVTQAYSPLSDAQIGQYANTNWNDYFFRTGVSQNHVLSITSGSKNLSTFNSFGYFDQQGILRNTDLKRFNLRTNVNGKSDNGKFNYATNVTLNFSRRNEATSVGTGGVNQNFVLGANNSLPYITPDMYQNSAQVNTDYGTDTIFDPDPTDANFGPLAGTLAYTPLFLIDKMRTFSNRIDEFKGIVGIDASYQIFKNVTVGINQGVDYTQTQQTTYQSPGAFNSLIFEAQNGFLGQQTELFSRDIALTTNTRLNYNKVFAEKHSFDITLFTEYYKAYAKTINFTQNGVDPKTGSPGTGYVPNDPGTPLDDPAVGSGLNQLGLFSYFAVADYDYNSKYGIGATIRRDASSRFANTNRWGTFYAVSGRWNIDKESFMGEKSPFSMLKLRGSYGTNGNQQIELALYDGLNATRELYDIGVGYQGQPSYQVVQLANSDLKWETTTQFDLGLDWEVFNRRFSGSVDFYRKKTTDLYQDVYLSPINATPSLPANFGEMYNQGFEATLSYDLFQASEKSDFNLTLKFNGSYNKNRVSDVPTDEKMVDNGLTVLSEGHVLGEFFVVRYAGVNPLNGEMLYLDKDGNYTESPDVVNDRVYSGKSSLPVYQGGFGFDADYKGFFLTTQFSFAKDVWRYDYDLSGVQDPTNIGVFNMSTDILRAWTEDNRVTDMPSLLVSNAGAFESASDRYLRDASYVRLRFLSLGYEFPKKMLDKTPFSKVKTFIQAENLATWSKWRGWDAESPRGSDQYQYPTPRILSAGFTLEF